MHNEHLATLYIFKQGARKSYENVKKKHYQACCHLSLLVYTAEFLSLQKINYITYIHTPDILTCYELISSHRQSDHQLLQELLLGLTETLVSIPFVLMPMLKQGLGQERLMLFWLTILTTFSEGEANLI